MKYIAAISLLVLGLVSAAPTPQSPPPLTFGLGDIGSSTPFSDGSTATTDLTPTTADGVLVNTLGGFFDGAGALGGDNDSYVSGGAGSLGNGFAAVGFTDPTFGIVVDGETHVDSPSQIFYENAGLGGSDSPPLINGGIDTPTGIFSGSLSPGDASGVLDSHSLDFHPFSGGNPLTVN